MLEWIEILWIKVQNKLNYKLYIAFHLKDVLRTQKLIIQTQKNMQAF